jgi:hypothetical protein
MMTDDDSQALEGEIVGPEGDGRWEPATIAHTLLGIGSKTLYRRVERGQLRSRKNDLGRLEVWVPSAQAPPQSLATTGGVSVGDTREIVASLVAALTESQRLSEERLERAIRAETLLAQQERLSLTQRARQGDNVWERIKRWWSGTWDSQ